MALYTFYPRAETGVTLTFEAYELASDQEARTTAEIVLKRHGTSIAVSVWEGDREVVQVSRAKPGDDRLDDASLDNPTGGAGSSAKSMNAPAVGRGGPEATPPDKSGQHSRTVNDLQP